MTISLDYLIAHPVVAVPRAIGQLVILGRLDEGMIAMRYPHLGQYAQRWDALVRVRPGVVDFREVPMKLESVKSGILESLRTVMCTEKMSLPRKFPLMFGAMKCIELISP
jgi:hypothetical protein